MKIKPFKLILQNSCSEKCQQSHVCGEVKGFIIWNTLIIANGSPRACQYSGLHNSAGHVSSRQIFNRSTRFPALPPGFVFV